VQPHLSINSRQAGSILLVVLVFLLVLGKMVMSGVERAQLARRLEFNFSDRGHAFHAAESALVFAEHQFLDVLAAQGIFYAATRWPADDTESRLCHASSRSGGSDFTEDSVGSSLPGFSALASPQHYWIQSGWLLTDTGLSEISNMPESEAQSHCGVLYLAQSCGFGRDEGTVVHLQLRVMACCDHPDGCAQGQFYGHQRRFLERR
jgi:hypothetical protein